MDEQRSTLVLGLGNPILGDDGVGWRAAEAFRTQWEAGIRSGFPSSMLPSEAQIAVEVDFLSVGGLSLMERMIGYWRVILIDAALTRQRHIGEVSCFPIEQLPPITQGHLAPPTTPPCKTHWQSAAAWEPTCRRDLGGDH